MTLNLCLGDAVAAVGIGFEGHRESQVRDSGCPTLRRSHRQSTDRCNKAAPGAIQTDFSGGVVRDNAEVNRHIGEVTALGRPGLPDDIGPMIASLVSEDNRWVNAQRIEVSGGQAI